MLARARPLIAACLLVAAALAAAPAAVAEVDRLDPRLALGDRAPLRWENIEGHYYWVAGSRPRRAGGVHRVRLAAGDTTTVHLPREEILRIERHDRPETDAGLPEGLRVEISNGSGAYREIAVSPTARAGTWLVDEPALRRRHHLVRLTLAETAAADLELALYRGRRFPVADITPYRERIDLGGEALTLRRRDAPGRERFHRLPPDTPQSVRIEGPLRVRIDSHALPRPQGPGWPQAYTLTVRLDGELVRRVQHATGVDETRLYQVQGEDCLTLLTRRDSAYVDIPPGEHELTVSGFTPTLVRPLGRRSQDNYLMPELNAHHAPALETLRRILTSEPSPAGLWAQVERILDRLEGPARALQALDLIRELAQSNEYIGTGLIAANIAERLASRFPGHDGLRERAAEAWGRATFARDLWPRQGRDAYAAWYDWHSLTTPGATPRYLSRRAARQRLVDAPAGRFVEIEPRGELTYPVPPRPAPSRLRLVIDRRTLTGPVELRVRVGDDAPTTVRAAPWRPAPGRVYRSAAGISEALSSLMPGGASQPEAGSSATALAADPAGRRPLSHLTEAAVVELRLPAGVSTVRIRSRGRGPAHVALAYRAARPFSPPPSRWLALEGEGDAQIWSRWTGALTSAESAGIDRDLQQGLAPLSLELRAAARRLTQSTPDTAPAGGPDNSLDTPGIERLRERATAAGQRGDPVTALQHWTELARRGPAGVQVEAFRGRIAALQRLDERFLAEQLLKTGFLNSPVEAVRREAYTRLTRHYRREAEPVALESVLATELIRARNPAAARQLITLWLDEGEAERALLLGLLLPGSAAPPAPLVDAAWRLRWWRVFEHYLTRLGPQARQTWTARRERMRGAGGEGSAPDASSAKAWEWADDGVRRYAGVRWLRNRQTGATGAWFLATGDDPVAYDVPADTRLRLEIRPLHDDSGALDGWLRVHTAGATYRRAINHNRPAPGLELVAPGSGRPGTREVIRIEAGPEGGRIEIDGMQRPVLVRMAWRLPAWPRQRAGVVGLDVTPAAAPDAVRPARRFEPCANQWLPVLGAQPLAWRALHWQRPTGTGAAQVGRVSGAYATDKSPQAGRPEALTPRQARARMTEILWRVDTATPGAALTRLRLRAEALAAAHPADPDIAAMRYRLNPRAGWERIAHVDQSAGVRRMRLQGWDPASAALRARRTFLDDLSPDEYVLTGDEALVFRLPAAAVERFALQLRAAAAAPIVAEPLRVSYRISGGASDTITLEPGATPRRLRMDLPQGSATVRLAIDNPIVNHVVVIGAAPGPGRETLSRLLRNERDLTFQVATPGQPVTLRVEGPDVLRIDERRGRQWQSRLRIVDDGWQQVQLTARDGEEPSYYRIQRRVPETPGTAARFTRLPEHAPLYRRAPAMTTISPPETAANTTASGAEAKPRTADAPADEAGWRYSDTTRQSPDDEATAADSTPDADASRATAPTAAYRLEDAFARPGQEDGTLELRAGWRAEGVSDQEPDVTAVDRHGEFEAAYRRRVAPHDLWWQARGIFRPRPEGNATVGLAGRVYYQPPTVPVDLYARWTNFYQSSGDTAFATTLRAGATQYRSLGPALHHRPFVEGFVRELHQGDDFELLPGTTDRDVWSRFKTLHPRGLTVGDTLTYSPWVDTRLSGEASLTSDEYGSLFTPERARLRADWRQRLDDWQLNLGVQASRFFAQQGHEWRRPDGETTARLRGRLSWERWQDDGDRLEADLWTLLDPESGDTTVGLSLRWHDSRGRGFRDFAPGGVSFRELRRAAFPDHANNRLIRPGNR